MVRRGATGLGLRRVAFDPGRSSQLQHPADIIRQHRDEHARDWLESALEMVLETGAIEPVLQRFLPSVA